MLVSRKTYLTAEWRRSPITIQSFESSNRRESAVVIEITKKIRSKQLDGSSSIASVCGNEQKRANVQVSSSINFKIIFSKQPFRCFSTVESQSGVNPSLSSVLQT